MTRQFLLLLNIIPYKYSLIMQCVKRKFGAKIYFARAKELKKKCNQRCLERARKRRKLTAPEENNDTHQQ